MKPNHFTIVIATVGLTIGMALNLFAQTTNVIPQNIFLTDDGQVFSYKPGKRLVDLSKIKAAENSQESRPSSEDTEGHWGQATNGFQISIRFDKKVYTNGEHVIAITLIRNITSQSQTYFRPTRVVAMKDGKLLPKKNVNDINVIEINAPLDVTLFPQTQHRYINKLDQIYDLSENGEYVFQAECRSPEAESQTVNVLITNTVQIK